MRRVIVALWIAGGILFGLGTVGDVAGVWTGIPFLTNMITALTGFCFAVPFAVLVLQELARQQASQAARRATLADARLLVLRLAVQGEKLQNISTPYLGAGELSLREPVREHIDRALNLAAPARRQDLEHQGIEELASRLAGLCSLVVETWEDNFGRWHDVLEAVRELNTVCLQLDRDVRGRLILQGINWPIADQLQRVQRASDDLSLLGRPFHVGGSTVSSRSDHEPWISRIRQQESNLRLAHGAEELGESLDSLHEAFQRAAEDHTARYLLNQAVHDLVGRCDRLARDLPLL
ncbi:hypothetical protein [Nonomuraea sp. NPDC046570]|uniref:hypothetical protein n=1 Tax=Nonomuraea sp. NPDC046570 TaxID=3155255 RepID=UPI0033E3254E